ncbi:MmgE/PrpD family protein [Microbulbifer sp. DLAB2-AF]|uniref:MmgE/PrpD family protein n=1 Tax=Microbulbifer sp. DLAB2-AF TaxID=3243395 RepID=UPI00403A2157
MNPEDLDCKISEELVNFSIKKYTDRDFPKEVESHTLKLLLNSIGLMLAGSTFNIPKDIISLYERKKLIQNSNKASIIGFNKKSFAVISAKINSILANQTEFDETSMIAIVHPSTIILSTALAIGEEYNASGADVFYSYCIGLEIFVRLGTAFRDDNFYGFYNPTVVGPLASSITAGLLMRLNEEQLLNAFCIAASYSGGVQEWADHGGSVKRMLCSVAVGAGIESAYYASINITAPHTVIEGKHGICNFSKERNFNIILNHLGQKFLLMETAIKKYNCCNALHGAVEAVEYLINAHPINVNSIRSIKIGVSKFTIDHCSNKNITDSLSAQLSIYYVVALTFTCGSPTSIKYDEKLFKDEKILSIMDSIYLYQNPDYTDNCFGANVKVVLLDGSCYDKEVIDFKGSANNPLSLEEVKNKFFNIFPTPEANKCNNIFKECSKIKSFEKIIDLTKLIAL